MTGNSVPKLVKRQDAVKRKKHSVKPISVLYSETIGYCESVGLEGLNIIRLLRKIHSAYEIHRANRKIRRILGLENTVLQLKIDILMCEILEDICKLIPDRQN